MSFKGVVSFEVEQACLTVLDKTYPNSPIIFDYDGKTNSETESGFVDFALNDKSYRVNFIVNIGEDAVYIMGKDVHEIECTYPTNTISTLQ